MSLARVCARKKNNFWAKGIRLVSKKALREMYSKGFCHKGETILKCGRQYGRQKQGFLSKKRVFDRIKLSNIQKNRAFMRLFCIITRFWCGRKERKRRNSEERASRNLPFPQAEPRQGVEIRDIFFEKNESTQAVFLA